MDEKSFQSILPHYFKVLEGKELSLSHKASYISVENFGTLTELWIEHESIRKNILSYNQDVELKDHHKPVYSLLDLKIRIAELLFGNCIFCERRCEIDRNREKGYCGVKNTKIASEFLHTGEETPIIPSHTIFFTGCTFNCVYCQNMDISQNPHEGMFYPEEKLALIIDEKKKTGSMNVNFVGGDPNPHLLYILKTIRQIKENIPVIWNSNFYMSLEVMFLLEGVVDLYLSDFKYGNDECAMRLSDIPDYWEVITRNHKMAIKTADMIIRHLILPNHVECCTLPILDWISENLGKNVVINIMAQYRPVYGAVNHDDISRFLYQEEYLKAVEYARELGFKNLI
ncbi:MAG TPA: radical SAM protein [Methanobacterium sp.]|nr:radical SAM protein [Methanobacterium sp.]